MIVNQVVRFAVYVYFTLSLIASQEVSRDPYTFVPIFLILKVGEKISELTFTFRFLSSLSSLWAGLRWQSPSRILLEMTTTTSR